MIQSREIVAQRDLPPELGGGHQKLLMQKQYSISTMHEIVSDDSGEAKVVELNLAEESKGTQNLFFFSPILKKAFETGEVLCIDEFDANLHPVLLKYIVSLFNNPIVNKNNAQLIISSHSTFLLDLSLLRRDQFYFVEKNPDTGNSELFSMDEFSVRKGENIRTSYLLGRFGAIPDTGEGDTLWE